MTKQLCTVAALLLAGSVGAQTQKGNGLISGNLSLGYSRYNTSTQQTDDKQSVWQPQLRITAGHFVADNWLAGLSVSGALNVQTSNAPLFPGQVKDAFGNSNVSVDITPFARRYWQFAPVQVFAGAGLTVGLTDSRMTDSGFDETGQPIRPTERREKSFQVNPYLEAGVNYFLTNRLALQLVASTRSLPFALTGLSTGLVYWTGNDRKADPQQARDNQQTVRGNWIIEGSFSSNRTARNFSADTTVDRYTSAQYAISPSVGYFIRRNTLLGVSIPVNFGSTQGSAQNTQAYSYWSVSVSPYIQHYWASTRLTPFTRIGATYLAFQSNSGYPLKKPVSLSASFNIGLAYMPGRRFIIETSFVDASLAYVTTRYDFGPTYTSWNTTLSAGLRGSFAVRYVLTRLN